MDNPRNLINRNKIQQVIQMAGSCDDDDWEMFANNSQTEGVKREFAAFSWNEFRSVKKHSDGTIEVLEGRSGLLVATPDEVIDWLISSGNWTKSRLALFGFTSEQLQAIMNTLMTLP